MGKLEDFNLPKLNITIPTAVGNLQIYVNPTQQAKARKLIKDIPKILEDSYNITATKLANRIVAQAKSCISHGTPPKGSHVSWPPHSERTIKRIGNHPLLYWSSQYYHHISVLKRGKTISAGVKGKIAKTRPDGGKPSGLTLSQVAKILENGTEDGLIPERPLWRPLYEIYIRRGNFKVNLAKEIRNQIRKYR